MRGLRRLQLAERRIDSAPRRRDLFTRFQQCQQQRVERDRGGVGRCQDPLDSGVERRCLEGIQSEGITRENPLGLDSSEIPLVAFQREESPLQAVAASIQPALLAFDAVTEFDDIGVLQILQGDLFKIVEDCSCAVENRVELQPRFRVVRGTGHVTLDLVQTLEILLESDRHPLERNGGGRLEHGCARYRIRLLCLLQ